MSAVQETHIGAPRCPDCGGPLPAGATCGSCAVLRTARARSRLEFTVRQSEGTGVEELELTPEFLSRFTLERVLGRGTSGMVLLATDRRIERRVAIKVLMRLEDEDRARFVAEGQMLARLSSPHIVPVLVVGELGTHPYLVTGYQPGGTLRDRLAAGALPAADAVRIALEILAGVEACHRAGIVHRDVKPENILFGEDGAARLADLGIARHYGEARRMTQAGALLGTPLYMSPEQVRGEDAGTASDVHAVGLVLFEMLAGRPAVEGRNLADVLAAKGEPIQDVKQVVPDLPEPLAAAVNAATALKIADRPATAAEMIRRLERAIGGRPSGKAAAPDLRARARATAAPKAGPGALVAAACIAMLLAGLAVQHWFSWRAPEPKLAEQARDVESNRAAISWKTSRACFSQVEYWPAAATGTKLTTQRLPIMQDEHRHVLPDLTPDTTYNFRFLYTYNHNPVVAATSASEVFDFTTRPEIQIFNVHVDEYATKAVISWETNLRTDTKVKYGRTDRYEELRSNREQKAEKIHSIALESLSPDATYHYQIVAGDPRGRGQPKLSDDLQLRTYKEDPSPSGSDPNSGMRNLVKSYVDKLSRMTPDEREKLKTSIDKFTDDNAPLTAVELRALAGSRTDPAKADAFYNRLVELRTLVGKQAEARQALFHLERDFHVNPLRAAERMDRAIADVIAQRPLTLASVRAATAPGPTPPARAPDNADAKLALQEGEQLFKEGRALLEQHSPDHAARFTEAARLCARAARANYQKSRALFYVGSSLLYRDASPEDVERACDLLAKSLALDSDKWTLLNLGQAHALAGRVDRALPVFEQALDVDAKWALAHYLYSGLLDKLPPTPDRGRKVFQHVKAAVREKSEYKRKYVGASRFSEKVIRSARFVSQIIEKSAGGQLTDAETDKCANLIAEDPSYTAVFVSFLDALNFNFTLADLFPASLVFVARAVISPMAALAGWFGPAAQPTPVTTR